MQKTIYSFILWALAASMFSACDNDLDVAADWKEIAVVYGLLNPTDDVQYIRIQRAYLDEVQGALRFKDETDSLYFDSLIVRITEFKNSVETNTYDLTRIDGNLEGIQKDSGLFNTSSNYLYRLKAKINRSSFANDYSYKLTILNPETGYLVTASTLTVGAAEIDAPITVNSDELIITDREGFKVVGAYVEGKNAKAYDMIMRIRVEEIDDVDTMSRDTLSMDWIMFRGSSS